MADVTIWKTSDGKEYEGSNVLAYWAAEEHQKELDREAEWDAASRAARELDRQAAEEAKNRAEKKYKADVEKYQMELGIKLSDFKKAAEQGDSCGQYWLGQYYAWNFSGPFMYVEDKYKMEAAKWFLKAAEQGQPAAQVNLSYYYTVGWGGLPQDIDKALYWLEKAVDQGYTKAHSLPKNFDLEWMSPRESSDKELERFLKYQASIGNAYAIERCNARGLNYSKKNDGSSASKKFNIIGAVIGGAIGISFGILVAVIGAVAGWFVGGIIGKKLASR